jgi:hypothetical protein
MRTTALHLGPSVITAAHGLAFLRARPASLTMAGHSIRDFRTNQISGPLAWMIAADPNHSAHCLRHRAVLRDRQKKLRSLLITIPFEIAGR